MSICLFRMVTYIRAGPCYDTVGYVKQCCKQCRTYLHTIKLPYCSPATVIHGAVLSIFQNISTYALPGYPVVHLPILHPGPTQQNCNSSEYLSFNVCSCGVRGGNAFTHVVL